MCLNHSPHYMHNDHGNEAGATRCACRFRALTCIFTPPDPRLSDPSQARASGSHTCLPAQDSGTAAVDN